MQQGTSYDFSDDEVKEALEWWLRDHHSRDDEHDFSAIYIADSDARGSEHLLTIVFSD